MKLLNTKTLAALAITGALSISTASAMGLDAGTQSLNSVIGVSSASISVNLDDGVATLFGNAESGAESALTASHVAKLDCVERVINLLTYN